jgi:hypothetical protein
MLLNKSPDPDVQSALKKLLERKEALDKVFLEARAERMRKRHKTASTEFPIDLSILSGPSDLDLHVELEDTPGDDSILEGLLTNIG